MKRIILLLSISALFFGCDNRTPQQKAQDEFNSEQKEFKEKEIKHKKYIDSLVNVAGGMTDERFIIKDRMNALSVLKKDYPELKDEFDNLEKSIRNDCN